jgi:hypothetical protein
VIASEPAPARGWRLGHLRWLLLVVGAAALVWLIARAGPARVAHVLLGAGPWLPVVLLLEALWMWGADVIVLRVLTGLRPVVPPVREIFRATRLAYALMILAPAGRATGEIARSAVLSRFIGASAAAVTGAHVHAAMLLGNAAMCAVVGTVVWAALGSESTLTRLVLANVAFVGLAATGLVLLARSPRFAGWVARKLGRFSQAPPSTSDPRAARPPLARFGIAVVVFFLARCVQSVQFGIALLAVSGHSGVRAALVAHSVHLVATNLGDIVPGQVGVTETSYTAFAPELGLADAPEKALSLPLLIRFCQLVLAAVCMLLAAFRPSAVRAVRPDEQPDVSAS